MGFVRVGFMLSLMMVCAVGAEHGIKLFNVKDYGAVSDGKADNSKHGMRHVNGMEELGFGSQVAHTLLNSVTFQGPCKGWMAFVIKGILKAPTDIQSLFSNDIWINFQYVDRLAVSGGGTLDGQGAVAWPHNEGIKNPNSRPLLCTMGFGFVTNSRVHHLRSIDSKNTHFGLFRCDHMNFTKIRISAPANSPNTDGIKIGQSSRIKISRVVIGTGDDCISLVSGNKKIDISQVVCGPGHGISIGSLGRYKNERDVEEISVKNCTFYGTSNGVRIKTWASPIPVEASNIIYEDIVMNNVSNPIIIDQQYCPYPPCSQTPSNVQVSGVTYKNIRGSSSSNVAVSLRCSQSKPCKDITMEDIDLWHQGAGSVSEFCSHVSGVSYGKQNPPSCL
ncbi:putative Pectin lyase-like superfamily protein [Quillaja saponaria]|uniref:Pectin lyase-like superfamily protein n=1 Tax=Quillaja saponaria TaxID=32244 RepID=A0AAD7PNU6_QUISA|nr:putative Pectin lyase-like superfamily protein [Quillaja saponaria]